MTKPIFDITIAIDVASTVGEDTGVNYDSNIQAIYDVTGTLLNPNGDNVYIYRAYDNVLVDTITSGSFNDNTISLPEMRQYYAVFDGQDERAYFSVSYEMFANLLDDELLRRAINYNKQIPSTPTQYGYPVFEVEYSGQTLTEYADTIFADGQVVPWYVNPAQLPLDVLTTSSYMNRANVPFLMSYSQVINLTPAGQSFVMKDGYTYMSFMTTPGIVKTESIFISLKKNSVIGSGIELNIYGGTSSSVIPTLVATSTVAHIDINEDFTLVEFKLDQKITMNGLWVQLIPLNPSSEYEFNLANPSFNVATKYTRYTRLYDAGVDQGELFTGVLIDTLDTIYPGGYPVVVTSIPVLVTLNKLYQDVFGFTTGFSGPCIVAYQSLSLIQLADTAIYYGADSNASVEQIVASINSVPNYAAFINNIGMVGNQSIYTVYLEPELNLTSPVTDIELTFSDFVYPDGNNRKVKFLTNSLMALYESKRAIELKPPYLANSGEWRPVVEGGFVHRPKLVVGEEIYVDGYGYDEITAIDNTSVTLDNSGTKSAPLVYELPEPANYSVLIGSERPTQLSLTTFKLSKAPLFLSGGVPSTTFVIGDKFDTDVTSHISDWDIDSGVIITDKQINFETNKHIKYAYIETGNILTSIDLRDDLDGTANLYMNSAGTIINYSDTDDPSFVLGGDLYVKIGAYAISSLTKPDDIGIIDIRKRGGGLVENITFEQAFKQNVGVVGFYDIGFYDGMNIPQMVLQARLPNEIKDKFTDSEVEEILHTHTNAGTKVYPYYGIEFEKVSNSGPIALEDESGYVLLEDGSGDPILTED